ncbi:MAG: D-sedoheptulose 7-phosphate isomerase [Kiritimatiellae bacterium]|jgi:D-sedoheptulose 7-phosphate isomerase|nr:D-sedoheptulose 7-phosphate isomerase [Kiritimatiellia bacterium]MDD4341143.1 D-sedoheptulose 7-phosphate isomerase [Kiritimatiellia bacterium]MDY0150391.1 D-sedoheptulose 7-phosphate isomerase [Kiritimatiellia bacterium]
MDWDGFAEGHLDVAHEVLTRLRPAIEAVAAGMVERLRQGGKVLLCGNGGSAADAQHFAAELVNRFQRERRPYAALALTTDTSVLTSIANDYAFDQIFSKQVEALARPNDMLLAISTSGNAANVCRAVEAATTAGLWTVALCGGKGGGVSALADEVLCIAGSGVTARIQEGHIMIIHALCELIEEALAE